MPNTQPMNTIRIEDSGPGASHVLAAICSGLWAEGVTFKAWNAGGYWIIELVGC